jgi:hypothetical protein
VCSKKKQTKTQENEKITNTYPTKKKQKKHTKNTENEKMTNTYPTKNKKQKEQTKDIEK